MSKAESFSTAQVFRTPPLPKRVEVYSAQLTPHVLSTKTSPGISPDSSNHFGHSSTAHTYLVGKVSQSSRYSDDSSGKAVPSSTGKPRATMYNKLYQNMFKKAMSANTEKSTASASGSTSAGAHKPLKKATRPAKPGGDRLNVSMQTQQSESREQLSQQKMMERLCLQINLKLKGGDKDKRQRTEPDEDATTTPPAPL